MTNVDLVREAISFAVYDLLPSSNERGEIVLKERDGPRYLLIRVGPNEYAAAETARDAPEPGDDRTVVVSGLTDGTFRSHLLASIDGKVVATQARTADALILAIKRALPILVAPEVARFAGVTPRFPEVTRNGIFYAAVPDEPIAAIPYPSISAHRRARGRRLLRTLSVVAFVLVIVAGAIYWREPRSIQIPVEAFLLFGCGFSLVGFFGTERLQGSKKTSTLLVTQVGLIDHVTKRFATKAGWSRFGQVGKIEGWMGMGREGLIYVRPIPFKIGPLVVFRAHGFPLSHVDPNWRTGELGGLVRLYAPRVFGIEPVDPDGGALVF